MAKVTWTLQSLDDVEAICNFIEKDSIHYSRVFANSCFDEVNILHNFPLAGRGTTGIP